MARQTKDDPETDDTAVAVPIANATFATRKTGAAPIPAESTPAAPNSTFASRHPKKGAKAVQSGENKAVTGGESK